MAHGYKFYMQQVDKEGNLIEGTKKDLEVDFEGLKYSKLEGIDTKGKAKDVYTETYSDADKLRVWIPENVHLDATTLTLTLYFFGENREDVFDAFCEYIQTGLHRYSDTARNRWFDFYVADEIKPSDEKWYAGLPYFKAEIKLHNLYGKTNKQ